MFGLAIYFYVKKKWSAEDKETRQVLYFVHRIVGNKKRKYILSQTTGNLF